MTSKSPHSDPLNPTLAEGHFPIMEQFYTIQGEGVHQGSAAYFIRLAGCDVGCVWCDVKESWHRAGYPVLPAENLAAEAAKVPTDVVVVTGGEPTMYPLAPLTMALHDIGKRTHIETSGAHPLTGDWHWVCLSPKKFKPVLDGVHARADELKVVIYHPSDFAFAEEHASKVGENCALLLQPEWGRINRMMPAIVEFVKKHPLWRISLQDHKYMNIP